MTEEATHDAGPSDDKTENFKGYLHTTRAPSVTIVPSASPSARKLIIRSHDATRAVPFCRHGALLRLDRTYLSRSLSSSSRNSFLERSFSASPSATPRARAATRS